VKAGEATEGTNRLFATRITQIVGAEVEGWRPTDLDRRSWFELIRGVADERYARDSDGEACGGEACGRCHHRDISRTGLYGLIVLSWRGHVHDLASWWIGTWSRSYR
jgi:hypothetical protein